MHVQSALVLFQHFPADHGTMCLPLLYAFSASTVWQSLVVLCTCLQPQRALLEPSSLCECVPWFDAPCSACVHRILYHYSHGVIKRDR
jgi:hypothetical protein